MGRTGSQATEEPPATEEASGSILSILGGDGAEEVKYSSVSAGADHTCGVRTGGAVACWGDQARGLTQPAN